MRGLMQERPLLISSLLEFAAREHGDTEIVSRTAEGDIHRYTYAQAERRAARLAGALLGLGVAPGDRIGTLAWNGHRHFELYYGVSGIGAVCHTINPRLPADRIAYIIGHAGDSYLFVEPSILPVLEQLAGDLETVKGIVVMTEAETMPETPLAEATEVLCYETLLAGAPEATPWPSFDENTASLLCYTSGTTGDPKGVLYSHRSTVLHTYAANGPDVFGFRATDTVMPVVPMFHVTAWGTPYAATMAGAKLVLPGPRLDGASLAELIVAEGVTFSAGVPTVWLGLLAHLRETGGGVDCLRRVTIGGAACPRAVVEEFDQRHGVRVDHAWGMTETSPVGTYNAPKPWMSGFTPAERHDHQDRQGRGIYGIEMRAVDDEGRELPRDGVSSGILEVRGHWVCSDYFRGGGEGATDAEGWFATGDVATIDGDGYMRITDRIKDVIKSGGEWISSIELENIAVSHPAVAEAGAVAIPHPKWGERPLLVVVPAKGAAVDREELLAYYRGKVADWMIPDDVVLVEELPHTATGKVLKADLRARFRDHVPPEGEKG